MKITFNTPSLFAAITTALPVPPERWYLLEVAMIASSKVWAYGMYGALAASLLYVIAHSAKWI